MSKFYNISFVILTVLNFISLVAIYYLSHHHEKTIEENETKSISQTPSIVIDTDLGKIAGLKSVINSTEIHTFLGIPYAEPPINELRFKKPQAKNKWSNVYNAFKWPNPCMQPDQSLQLNNFNFSEDCLYLNIWTPETKSIDEPISSLKPVLVVIHTGAFIFGSSSEAKYNGLYLSYKANSIVVTFNYRLNFYGFYYSQEQTKVTPNLGMLDQVAALKWIRKNIQNFNGDPNKITLVGQSSAALSIGMHITSPMSRNLFQQAILMSGSPFQIIPTTEPKHVSKFWNNYKQHLHCEQFENEELLLKCLDDRIKSNRNNLITMELVKKLSPDKLFVNIPIVQDDLFQPGNQFELLQEWKKNQSEKFSILYGYTNDEGSWISMLEDSKIFGPESIPNLSHYQALAIAEEFLNKMFFGNKFINKTKVLEHYLNNLLRIHQENLNLSNDTVQIKTILHRLISNMLGDRYIVCPMEQFVQSVLDDSVGNNETKQLVFQYLWKYKGDHLNSAFWNVFQKFWCGNWMGSCHSFEMFAMFGIPFLEPMLFDHYDRIISMKTIQIVKYFAWNGKLFWPEFQKDRKLFYIIDAKDDDELNYSAFIFGNNHKMNECSQIWN